MTIKENSIHHIQSLANTIVRYILAGGVFILAFGFLDGWQLKFLRFGSGEKDVSLWFTLILVTVVGALAYMIHRAIFYRLLLPVLMKCLIRNNPTLKGSKTWLELDRELSERRYKSRQENEALQNSFDRWAAEVHFLYASSAGAIFAFLAFRMKQPTPGLRDWIVLCVSLILLVAAIVHDLYLMREEINRKYPSNPNAT